MNPCCLNRFKTRCSLFLTTSWLSANPILINSSGNEIILTDCFLGRFGFAESCFGTVNIPARGDGPSDEDNVLLVDGARCENVALTGDGPTSEIGDGGLFI